MFWTKLFKQQQSIAVWNLPEWRSWFLILLQIILPMIISLSWVFLPCHLVWSLSTLGQVILGFRAFLCRSNWTAGQTRAINRTFMNLFVSRKHFKCNQASSLTVRLDLTISRRRCSSYSRFISQPSVRYYSPKYYVNNNNINNVYLLLFSWSKISFGIRKLFNLRVYGQLNLNNSLEAWWPRTR